MNIVGHRADRKVPQFGTQVREFLVEALRPLIMEKTE